jgi:hypothetical protein
LFTTFLSASSNNNNNNRDSSTSSNIHIERNNRIIDGVGGFIDDHVRPEWIAVWNWLRSASSNFLLLTLGCWGYLNFALIHFSSDCDDDCRGPKYARSTCETNCKGFVSNLDLTTMLF